MYCIYYSVCVSCIKEEHFHFTDGFLSQPYLLEKDRLLAKWLHLSPSSKGLHASCHTFPIPHCEGNTGLQVSIDLFQSCDNWAIKISKRHTACGRDRV